MSVKMLLGNGKMTPREKKQLSQVYRLLLRLHRSTKRLLHHLQHDSSVYLKKPNSKLHRRLQAGKPLKKRRPRPKCKALSAENPSPKPQHSPLKLTFKTLPTCREPVFEVVEKKERVKSFAAMDEMIPDGRGVLPSQTQTTSQTPIDILREEDSSAVIETFNSLDTEQPLPSPPPVLTVKSPEALNTTITPNLVNILPGTSSDTLGLLRGVQTMEPCQSYIMETCEVCGERSDNIEQHRATMGHYKCHVLPQCAGFVFANKGELISHQHLVHGLSPTPQQQSLQQLQQQSLQQMQQQSLQQMQQQSLQQMQQQSLLQQMQLPQQVQLLTTPYGISTAPPAMGTSPPAISPSLGPLLYLVPSGVTLAFPGAYPSTTNTPQFAMQTPPSTIQPDGLPVPVASPTLPAGLDRSISISPSVKTAQKRATPSRAESEASKRSRQESPDCMLIEDGSAPPKVPKLPSGISLTVRGSQSQNSGVANILASRGITVTPAANETPPPPAPASNRASVTTQAVTTLNLSSEVSIVPASQSSRGQFTGPTGRKRGRQVTSTAKPLMVDLTQDSSRPSFRRRSQRTNLATHKLPYKCNLCNAQYPTQQAMLQHKQNYHKEAQGSEMALPVVDMKNPASINKLTSLGIRHCLVLSQLTNSSGGVFGLPIATIDNAKNPAVCNLGALGASNVLSLGPAKALR